MAGPCNCRRSTYMLAVGIVLSLVLFYHLRDDTAGTPKFIPAFTYTVTKIVTHTITATDVPMPSTCLPVKPKLEKHSYRSDGLLEVNYDGPHPIFELVREAEKLWTEKLQRASKSLVDAVGEYRRRYKRDPPKGFDLWWEYAMEHDVQLPDEYDQIFHDLEPFWGMEPSDLFLIQAELETKLDSYTIGKALKDAPVGILTHAFRDGLYDQLIAGSHKILELLNKIEHLLPEFRFTVSPHDVPSRLSDWGLKQTLTEAAAAKIHIGRQTLPKVTSYGWISACPSTSLARRIPINLDQPPAPPTRKTFIYNHRMTMDPCVHPQLFYHHGQFLSHNQGPGAQQIMVPEFSYCTTMLHHNIRIPVPYAWVPDVLPRDDDPEFDEKSDERLLWRGSNTGIFHGSTTRWRSSHRNFMVEYTNNVDGTVDVLIPPVRQDEKIGAPRKLKKKSVNPVFFDVAFTKKPIACSEDICPQLEELYPWQPYMSQAQAGDYRYILDVDGNGWSGRFKRLITSNSLIFKSTIYPEWYMDRVQPWLHYVPVQVDLSDLYDSFVFFRGDGNGEGSHEDLGKKIALAGREWSLNFWRKEDLTAYFFRLILEYARLMSEDRTAMSYTPNI